MRPKPILLTSLITVVSALTAVAAASGAGAADDSIQASSARQRPFSIVVTAPYHPSSPVCGASGLCIGMNGGSGSAVDGTGRPIGTSTGSLSYARNPATGFGTSGGFTAFELDDGPCGAGAFLVSTSSAPGQTNATVGLVAGGGTGGYHAARGTGAATLTVGSDGSLRSEWTLRIRCR